MDEPAMSNRRGEGRLLLQSIRRPSKNNAKGIGSVFWVGNERGYSMRYEKPTLPPSPPLFLVRSDNGEDDKTKWWKGRNTQRGTYIVPQSRQTAVCRDATGRSERSPVISIQPFLTLPSMKTNQGISLGYHVIN